MTSFSERMGFVKPPEFMQLDGISVELHNLLWNFCCQSFKVFCDEDEFEIDFSNVQRIKIIQREINDLLKKKDGTFCVSNNLGFSSSLALRSFDRLAWYEIYSVCEYLCQNLDEEACGDLNRILVRENSGFRLNDGCQLVPITNQQELDEVSEAQHSSVDMVALHMNKAVACFADREKPDYDNSIKEAVSALEALAQKITGEKGTLGALIKKLDLHPCLIQSVDKLYGYTSDGGIRHAKKDGDPEADFDTAKFVIVTASALINFITAKCPHE